MSEHTTIKDVAKKAGVSIATVSFVLNKNSDQSISERVRDRVMAVAKELNYHPRASAVGLAGRRTGNVAIIFYRGAATVSNQFHSHVIQGAIKETIQREYNLLFSYVEAAYRGFQDLPKIIRERNADGVVFLHIVSPKMIKDLTERNIPVVCVDPEPAVRGVDTLHFDAHRGGMLAAEHLILLGHKQLGFLVGALQQPSIRERLQGFKDAMEKYGLAFDERKQVFECKEYSYHSAYERTVDALQKYPKLTGMVCANDEMAAGCLRGAHELGLKVPRDLSVVGFDDITMANFTDPPLTTIRVDKDLLGRRAMARIIELVEAADRAQRVGARSAGTAKQRATREILPVELIVRESTAKPRH